MTKEIRVAELAEFDPSRYLDDDEAVADYIRRNLNALSQENPDAIWK